MPIRLFNSGNLNLLHWMIGPEGKRVVSDYFDLNRPSNIIPLFVITTLVRIICQAFQNSKNQSAITL